MSILKAFEDKKLVINNELETGNLLMNISKIYFGINPESLLPSFFPTVVKNIIERFVNITISDIHISFDSTEIVKREYVSLTRDEILRPVHSYWQKKIAVQIEIDIIKKKEIEKINKDNELIQFISLSKSKYIESVNSGVFLLDEYESNSIAKFFAKCISDEDKALLWENAKKEHHKRNMESESKMFKLVPSSERIYSRLFLEKCMVLKVKIDIKK